MKKILLLILTLGFSVPVTLHAGYQDVWTDSSGKNHYSEPSSSSPSGSGGGFWNSPKAVPPPPDDGGIQAEKDAAKAYAKEAFKYYKQGNWKLARESAMKWGSNTALGTVEQSYLYTAATENLWLQLAREEGRIGLSESEINECIGQYESTLSWDPSHRKSKQRVADLKVALEELRQAEYARNNPPPVVEKTYQEKRDEEIAAIQRALDRNPKDGEAHGKMGQLLYRSWDIYESIDSLEKAAQYGSPHAGDYSLLADLYSYVKDYEKAEAAARRAIELDPSHMKSYKELGFSLSLQDRFLESAEVYKQALEREPGNSKHKIDIANNLRRGGSLDEAQAWLDDIRKNDPDADDLDFQTKLVAEAREKLRREEEVKAVTNASHSEDALIHEQVEVQAAQVDLTAGEAMKELTHVVEHGRKAMNAESLEEAKVESGVGFDTSFNLSNQAEVAKPKIPSQAFQARLMQARDALTGQRLEVQSKLDALYDESNRDGLSESRGMEISRLQQEVTDITNKENYQAYLIEEDSRTNAARDADPPKAKGEPSTVSQNVDVSEMSIGGEALSETDKSESEEAINRIRQLAADDLRQKMMDQHQYSIDEEERRQSDDEWMESNPTVKKTILMNEQLMLEASEEYDRRQQSARGTLNQDELLMQVLGTPGAYPWPGAQSPDAPLENPVAREKEREIGVLEIYQELKQRNRLLQMYDRETEAAKEADE